MDAQASAGPAGGQPGASDTSLASAVQLIMANDREPEALAKALRTMAAHEVRETILASFLPGMQDPLLLLDISIQTVGILFILSARLTSDAGGPVDWGLVEAFCNTFNSVQARAAPERVTLLAKGIVKNAESRNRPTAAIEPLYHLLSRYAPDLSYLTTIHPIFVSTCLKYSHMPPALLTPVLSTPVSHISRILCDDLHYTDNLIYHYAGGCILGVWKDWDAAEEFLEICACAPAQTPSAIQLEAVKKLALIKCIAKGKSIGLPKYANPQLSRLLKNSAYGSFIRSYPRSTNALKDLISKEAEGFEKDKNTGLIAQAMERAPRWNLRRLTDTYLTLSLSDIGHEIGFSNVEDVRRLVLSMIEADEIAATISADDTVTFSDAQVSVSKSAVDAVLREAQAQADLLTALGRELGASREFLQKANKPKSDEERWLAGAGRDDGDEMFNYATAGGNWADSDMMA